MNRITKVFVLAGLSVMTTPSFSFADYQSIPTGQNYPDSYTQTYRNQSYDDSFYRGGEGSFMRNADDQYHRLNQENHNMYYQDRNLTHEGYDPNQGYSYHEQVNRNPQFDQQEKLLRGDSNYHYDTNSSYPQSSVYHQEHYEYNPSGHETARQHYPVYEYVLGKDGQWHEVSKDNSASSTNWQQTKTETQSRYNDKTTPESYPLNDKDSTLRQDSNAPSYDSSIKQKNDAAKNASAAYQKKNYPKQDQLVGDSSDDKTSSYNVSRNTSSKANEKWNTEDTKQSTSTTKRSTQR